MDLTVTVKRWFASKEMWNYIAGLALVVTIPVTNMIANLGLNPWELLFTTIGVQVVSYTAGAYLKATSKSVIGDKQTVADAKAVVDAPGNPTNETTVKVKA